jgi:hypothetical protein
LNPAVGWGHVRDGKRARRVIAYIAFVAVVNLLLGMLLARIVPPPRRGSTSQPVIPEPAERKVVLPPSLVIRIEPTPPDQSAPVAIKDEPELRHKERHAPPGELKTWADFAQQLRDVKDRARYCRPAQDMRLARQAAEQLKGCAQIWYGQFEKCLVGEVLDDATQALIEGADMSAVEMFAAQIETTLTNLNALDYNGPVNDVLDALDRELALLDSQQKSVGRGKKPALARL